MNHCKGGKCLIRYKEDKLSFAGMGRQPMRYKRWRLIRLLWALLDWKQIQNGTCNEPGEPNGVTILLNV